MKYLEAWSLFNTRLANVRERKIQRVVRERAKEDKLQLEVEEQWERHLEQLKNSRKDSNETV